MQSFYDLQKHCTLLLFIALDYGFNIVDIKVDACEVFFKSIEEYKSSTESHYRTNLIFLLSSFYGHFKMFLGEYSATCTKFAGHYTLHVILIMAGILDLEPWFGQAILELTYCLNYIR